ncbi:hypothetical protein ACWDSJ_36955 [Nocardia sp. NPDC003482]
MSGRKRIFVDQSDWDRLQADAGKLAQVRRDLPNLLRRVGEHTDRSIARARAEIDARHADFEHALADLSEDMRQAEARTEERLQETSEALLTQVRTSQSRLRNQTAQALRTQREEFQRSLDAERAEHNRRVNDLERKISGLSGERDRAEALTRAYLRDVEILRAQVIALPHERYLPGRLDELDTQSAALHEDLRHDTPAYLLSDARGLCRAMSALRAELIVLDAEWRALRCAAERDLLQLQGFVRDNSTLDVAAAFGTDATVKPPDVDHWSRGALRRLAGEVDALLVQVRDDESPPTAETLRQMIAETIPELDQRLDSVVVAAMTALRSSQLRANLAELITDALDRHHHYQVVDGDAGYVDGDQRAAFLAKSTNRASRGEIVVEVAPGPDETAPPTVRLHNFDTDASTEERRLRTESIHESVLDRTGIDLRTTEEGAEPDRTRNDVSRLVRSAEPAPATGSENLSV